MNETELPDSTPRTDIAVSLGGVTTEASPGAIAPLAAPMWNGPRNPDGSPAPIESAVQVAGTAPAPTTPVPDAGTSPAMREVRANLNAAEQLAIFWGGETGVKIRNHIIRVRQLLGV